MSAEAGKAEMKADEAKSEGESEMKKEKKKEKKNRKHRQDVYASLRMDAYHHAATFFFVAAFLRDVTITRCTRYVL